MQKTGGSDLTTGKNIWTVFPVAPKCTRFPLRVWPLSSVHTASSSAVLWQNSFIPRSQSSYQPAPFRQQQHIPVLLLLSSSFSSLSSVLLFLFFSYSISLPPTNPRGLAGKPNWFNYIVLIRGSCLRIEGNCTAECTVFSSPNGRLGKWRQVQIYPCRLQRPQPEEAWN